MRAKNRLSFVTIVTGVCGGQADLGCVERNCSLLGDDYREGKHTYSSRQVGTGLSEQHMKSPKFEHVIAGKGKNKGKEAALTTGNKRMPRDWFFKNTTTAYAD